MYSVHASHSKAAFSLAAKQSMMSNLFLKPQIHLLSFPSQLLFPHTLNKLNKPSILPFIPITTTFSTPHFSTTTTSLSYGPSLHKGTNPSQSQSQFPQNDVVLHEETFTRVFDLAALRVPSAECSALESRLRGHLLNWPRVRNIARVPGDDIDPNIAPLLGHQINGNSDEEEEGGKSLVSLQRRVNGKSEDDDGDDLTPVLYRDKLAKTFNSRGFVKFRNLAKISRPNRNKKKEKEGEGKFVEVEGNKRVGRTGFVVVEVVEEEQGGVDEGFRNLLGEEFGNGKWRGSTRLLLLDERYADGDVEALPEAIKVPFL